MALWPPDQAVVWRGHGLVLREWTGDDADSMVRLFDTEEMNRWTPLVSPFDRDVALQYVEQARRSRRQLGTLQLAVTEDGEAPLGEVLIFPAPAPGDGENAVELAYAVGAPFQGRGLARRAIAAALEIAATAGIRTARLTIATDNVRSQRVAVAAGFALTGAPLTQRRRKGFVLTMAVWERAL
jgi:RimJ/RimL family protein N-acetyltransferase